MYKRNVRNPTIVYEGIMAENGLGLVDGGHKTFTMTWVVNTKGMKKHESRHATHHSMARILEAAGTSHPDLLNIDNIQVSGGTNAGLVGLTFYNKRDAFDTIGPDGMPTKTHMYIPTSMHVCHSSDVFGDEKKYHTVLCGPVENQTTTLEIQSPELKKEMVQKKVDPRWIEFSDKNVKVGSTLITHEDSTKRMVHVAATGPDGTPSAIHRLIDYNKDNKGFMDGKYMASNLPNITTVLNGVPGVLMTEQDHNTAVKTLSTTLKICDPFQHGINVIVTKLDASPAEGDTFVRATFNRTPFDPDKGYVEPIKKTKPVLAAHVTALNGGKSASKAGLTPQEVNKMVYGYGGKFVYNVIIIIIIYM